MASIRTVRGACAAVMGLLLAACGGGGDDAVAADSRAEAMAVASIGYDRPARAGGETMCSADAARDRLYCWGAIGAPATPLISAPTVNGHVAVPSPVARGAIPSTARIAKIALGTSTACTITDDGAAYCWGANARGALGLGTAEAGSASPRAVAAGAVPAGVRFVDLAAAGNTFCAVGSDGRLWCWGDNTRIPNPALSSTGFSAAPVATVAGTMVSAARVALSTNVGCAIGGDGQAYCWKVGAITPALVAAGARPAGARYTDLQIGEDLPCATADDGEAYCWGTGQGRRFGAGSAAFVYQSAPIRVSAGARPAGVRWTTLSVGTTTGGAAASCALGSDGGAYCWGTGYLGSLGDGNLATHDALVPVAVLPGEKPAGAAYRLISCARYACSALAGDGQLYQWGGNSSEMLTRANPPLTGSAVPLRIAAALVP